MKITKIVKMVKKIAKESLVRLRSVKSVCKSILSSAVVFVLRESLQCSITWLNKSTCLTFSWTLSMDWLCSGSFVPCTSSFSRIWSRHCQVTCTCSHMAEGKNRTCFSRIPPILTFQSWLMKKATEMARLVNLDSNITLPRTRTQLIQITWWTRYSIWLTRCQFWVWDRSILASKESL